MDTSCHWNRGQGTAGTRDAWPRLPAAQHLRVVGRPLPGHLGRHGLLLPAEEGRPLATGAQLFSEMPNENRGWPCSCSLTWRAVGTAPSPGPLSSDRTGPVTRFLSTLPRDWLCGQGHPRHLEPVSRGQQVLPTATSEHRTSSPGAWRHIGSCQVTLERNKTPRMTEGHLEENWETVAGGTLA